MKGHGLFLINTFVLILLIDNQIPMLIVFSHWSHNNSTVTFCKNFLSSSTTNALTSTISSPSHSFKGDFSAHAVVSSAAPRPVVRARSLHAHDLTLRLIVRAYLRTAALEDLYIPKNINPEWWHQVLPRIPTCSINKGRPNCSME